MNDYKPNSNRFKEEQKQKEQGKKVEKVVTGKVITRKKSGFSKLADEFISEDAKNIKSYVIGDVIIPSIKKALCDIVKDGIEMLLYGGTRPGGGRSTSDRVSYRNYYDRGSSVRDTRMVRDAIYADDIILNSRGEAEDVLSRMDEIMDMYKLVRVADLYDLVGITAPTTANSYGWTNIRNAEIVRVRDGYMIKMPRAVPID